MSRSSELSGQKEFPVTLHDHELLLPLCLDVCICSAEFDLLSQLAISLMQLLLLDLLLEVYFLSQIC